MPKRLGSSSQGAPVTAALPAALPAASPIPATFTDQLPLPALIVFDLDYTLWPFWVDTHCSGPLKPQDHNSRMVDRWGESFQFYPEVPGLLAAARAKGVPMGLASRTSAPELAREMLRGLMIPPNEGLEEERKAKALRASDYFAHQQIFPGNKTTHFARIQDSTRKQGREVAFADMLFFDDEHRNRNVETELGVTFCLVRDGMTRAEMDRGVWEWRTRRGIARPPRAGAVELEG